MKNSGNKPERVKVYVKSLDKVGSVRRVEEDSVWGKQLLISTYSPEWGPLWGPDFHWVKESDVHYMTKINRT